MGHTLYLLRKMQPQKGYWDFSSEEYWQANHDVIPGLQQWWMGSFSVSQWGCSAHSTVVMRGSWEKNNAGRLLDMHMLYSEGDGNDREKGTALWHTLAWANHRPDSKREIRAPSSMQHSAALASCEPLAALRAQVMASGRCSVLGTTWGWSVSTLGAPSSG